MCPGGCSGLHHFIATLWVFSFPLLPESNASLHPGASQKP